MEGYQQNKPNCFLTQGTHIFFFLLVNYIINFTSREYILD